MVKIRPHAINNRYLGMVGIEPTKRDLWVSSKVSGVDWAGLDMKTIPQFLHLFPWSLFGFADLSITEFGQSSGIKSSKANKHSM